MYKIFLILGLWIYSTPAMATVNNYNNINIESDWAEVFHDRQEAYFYKNVVVKYQDMVIYCQKMLVKYMAQADNNITNLTDNTKLTSQTIESVEFIGKVHLINPITQEEIYSDYAVYNRAKQKVEASKNVKIVRADGTLSAAKYTYDIAKQVSHIQGNKTDSKSKEGRIKIIIDQPKQK